MATTTRTGPISVGGEFEAESGDFSLGEMGVTANINTSQAPNLHLNAGPQDTIRLNYDSGGVVAFCDGNQNEVGSVNKDGDATFSGKLNIGDDAAIGGNLFAESLTVSTDDPDLYALTHYKTPGQNWQAGAAGPGATPLLAGNWYVFDETAGKQLFQIAPETGEIVAAPDGLFTLGTAGVTASINTSQQPNLHLDAGPQCTIRLNYDSGGVVAFCDGHQNEVGSVNKDGDATFSGKLNIGDDAAIGGNLFAESLTVSTDDPDLYALTHYKTPGQEWSVGMAGLSAPSFVAGHLVFIDETNGGETLFHMAPETGDATFSGSVIFIGGATIAEGLTLGGDADIGGDVTCSNVEASGAKFDTCTVGGSPVITEETLPSGMVYPDAGIAVSTGDAWDTSIDPSSLLTYPGAGVSVSTGTAWGASIPAANLARTNASNTFTAAQMVNGRITSSVGASTSVLTANETFSTSSTTGTWIKWNQSGGQGETNFINIGVAGGNNGFNWYSTLPNVAIGAPVAALDKSGNLSTIGNITATGNVKGTALLSGTTDPTYSLHVVNSGQNQAMLETSVGTGFCVLRLKTPNQIWQFGTGGGLPQSWYVYDETNGKTVFSILPNTGNATFSGSVTASAKNFRILYPGDDTKTLTHSCIEGPEMAVFYRGEVETVNGSAIVTLPEYFEELTLEEGRTVLLTQMFDDASTPFSMLMASRIVNGKFTIRSSNPDAIVSWEVKAVRADLPPLVVVTDTEEPPRMPGTPEPQPKPVKAARGGSRG